MPKLSILILSSVFFLSGLAALIYQVAWQRLLTVYYGVGAISITLIVSIYMAGLGLGALLGGNLAERTAKKLQLYFFIELLIGCFGFSSVFLLDLLGKHTAGSSYIFSFFYMSAFLILPTFLMGMTLPLLTKIFNQIIQDFFDTVSFLYFVNTIGAAVGAVVASYVLITFWGLDTAVYCAAVINILLAGLIFLTQRIFSKEIPSQQEKKDLKAEGTSLGKIVYLLVSITGFLAIGYEILWFRVTGFLVKDSPYGFSSALAIYLLGIALGSFGMNKFLKRHPLINKRDWFFILQFCIGLVVVATFLGYFYLSRKTNLGNLTHLSFAQSLHPLSVNWAFFSFDKISFLFIWSLLDVFLWPLFFVFIPTLLMGASFPLISSLALKQKNQEAKTVGQVYFFNILGNILGGIVTGFVILPFLGTERTVLIFSIIGLLFGLFVQEVLGQSISRIARGVLLFSMILFSITFFPKAGQLYAMMHVAPDKGMTFYFEEGLEGVVGTFQRDEWLWNYIHGAEHGGRPGDQFYYQAIEACSFAPKLENVLVIGYGTGSTTEVVLKLPEVKKVTVVELNRTLIKNLKKIPEFSTMLSDPKLELIIEDGRRFLLGNEEKFDVIMIDALRTTSAYSNNLYSKQFFEIARDHLTPGGIFLMWADEHVITLRTLLATFDHVRAYGVFSLGSNQPFKRDQDRQGRLIRSFPEKVGSLARWSQTKTMKFIGSHYGRVPNPGIINEDWKPVCEYYLHIPSGKKKPKND